MPTPPSMSELGSNYDQERFESVKWLNAEEILSYIQKDLTNDEAYRGTCFAEPMFFQAMDMLSAARNQLTVARLFLARESAGNF